MGAGDEIASETTRAMHGSAHAALLAQRFGLDAGALALLLTAAATELEPASAAAMQDDVWHKGAPSVGWVMARAEQPGAASRAALERLECAGLIAVTPHPDKPRAAWRAATVEVESVVLRFLEGERVCSARVAAHARFVAAPEIFLGRGSELDASRTQVAEAIHDGRCRRVLITGLPGAGKKVTAAAVASELGMALMVLDARGRLDDTLGVLPLAIRDARLLGASLAVDLGDGLDDDEQRGRLQRALALVDMPLFVLARPREARAWSGFGVSLDVAPLTTAEQAVAWARALELRGVAAPDALDGALQPGLTFGAIDDAAAVAAARSRMPTQDDLREALRTQLRRSVPALASLVSAPYGWDDLVLPAPALLRLREVTTAVARRDQIASWGLARASSAATTVLLAGPPGTGKTMAAGVIARALGLDLYRVDLAQIASKYIGETEKNLARLFDCMEHGRAVLLFDEADSLFARRTDVKTSNDRHANLEVNYLLQRLESFTGIAILTTNFSKNLDEAFRRRMRFVLELAMPTAEERERLWRGAVPEAAELRGQVPWSRLAELELSGGHIHNAVMRAACAAAGRDDAILPYDLLRAALHELEAIGRLAPDLDTIAGVLALERPAGAQRPDDDVSGTAYLGDDAGDDAVGEGGRAIPDHEEPSPPEPRRIIPRTGMRPLISNFPFPRRDAGAQGVR